MKIYVVGSSKNKFAQLDEIREKFLIDQKHTEDNIDNLNPWYCELTGLYHLWKNCNEDIVGLEHYRRYFFGRKTHLNKSEVLEILNVADVIGTRFVSRYNLIIQFMSNKICKKEYLFRIGFKLDEMGMTDFRKYWFNYLKGKTLLQCNMFICKKEIINKYCEFFFDLVKDLELTNNNKRIVGFLSEYLLGAWMEFNNYRIFYCRRKDYK